MKPNAQAPLIHELQRLAVESARLAEGWRPSARELVGRPLVTTLHHAVASLIAARFDPAARAARLREADTALVLARTWLHTSREMAVVTAAQAQAFALRLERVGEMLGGWARYVEAAGDHEQESGRGAATGSTAAVRSTTMPTGRAPPTATGTPRTSRTRTRASARSAPPPEPATGQVT